MLARQYLHFGLNLLKHVPSCASGDIFSDVVVHKGNSMKGPPSATAENGCDLEVNEAMQLC